MIYCVHCDTVVLEHNNISPGKDILICPMCGSMFEREGTKYRYLGKLSGGNAAREFSHILNNINKE